MDRDGRLLEESDLVRIHPSSVTVDMLGRMGWRGGVLLGIVTEAYLESEIGQPLYDVYVSNLPEPAILMFAHDEVEVIY